MTIIRKQKLVNFLELTASACIHNEVVVFPKCL